MIYWYSVVTLVFMLMAGCTRTTPAEIPPGALEPEAPVQESWGVVYRLWENGSSQLRLYAGYMARYTREDSTYTLFRSAAADTGNGRVKVVWFDQEGRRSGTMYSNKLIYFNAEDRLVAKGNVVATMEDGKRIETEQLYWYGGTETIRAPGFVQITTSTDQIQGYNLVADEQFESYSLSKVTGQVRFQE